MTKKIIGLSIFLTLILAGPVATTPNDLHQEATYEVDALESTAMDEICNLEAAQEWADVTENCWQS